jgi:hypothetical protein
MLPHLLQAHDALAAGTDLLLQRVHGLVQALGDAANPVGVAIQGGAIVGGLLGAGGEGVLGRGLGVHAVPLSGDRCGSNAGRCRPKHTL